MEGIEIQDSTNNNKEILKADGVLVQIGFDANTDYLENIVPLDTRGQIIVNEKMATSVSGILAIGDIRTGSCGQVATAVGDGTTAAISAIKMLQ